MEEPWHRLRWKLCKTWGVKVDDEMFSEISNAQWLWYFYNYVKDGEEKFEQNRDFIEYHASFIEPQAVKKIRESRANAVKVSNEDFIKGIKNIFGRDIDLKNDKNKISSSDVNETLNDLDKNKILNSEFWDSLE